MQLSPASSPPLSEAPLPGTLPPGLEGLDMAPGTLQTSTLCGAEGPWVDFSVHLGLRGPAGAGAVLGLPHTPQPPPQHAPETAQPPPSDISC